MGIPLTLLCDICYYGIVSSLENYISGLVITQGEGAGEHFKVLPWQRRFLKGIADNRVSALSTARGNGKSATLGAIAAAAVAGPLYQPRGEAVICASSYGQARIVFEQALGFLMPLIELDKRAWRIQDYAQRSIITHRTSGASVKVIGSDPKRAHGLAPTLVIADEPAQWPSGGGEAMFSALLTSLGKVGPGRLVCIGTRPAAPDHWYSRLLDGGADYTQVHAGDIAKPFDKREWHKANPSMRHFPALADAVAADAKRAQSDASLLPAFLALRLNGGVSDVGREQLLEAATWERCGRLEAERRGPMVWGLDLGTNAAQSAVAAYWPETGRLEGLGAFPELPGLAERGQADGVGSLYSDLAATGDLIQTGEYAVDIAGLLREALNRFGRPAVLVADRWREAELRQNLQHIGMPPTALVTRGQGFRDGGEDVRLFRRAALDGKVSAPVNLLWVAAMAEAVVVSDTAGNAKLAKRGEGGRRLKARDDLVAAAILAVAEGQRGRTSVNQPLGILGIV